MTHPLHLLDGGMGRELLRRGAPFAQPEWSALALMQASATVQEVHAAYIAAGAETLTTNSYALVPFHIGEERFHARAGELAALAGKLARQAVTASGKNVTIAGSLPPLFGSYRPDLFDPARAAEIARPLIDGQAPYTDLWLAETQSSIAEVRACTPSPHATAPSGHPSPLKTNRLPSRPACVAAKPLPLLSPPRSNSNSTRCSLTAATPKR
jgi:homocysteine S-methyltransferase family protein